MTGAFEVTIHQSLLGESGKNYTLPDVRQMLIGKTGASFLFGFKLTIHKKRFQTRQNIAFCKRWNTLNLTPKLGLWCSVTRSQGVIGYIIWCTQQLTTFVKDKGRILEEIIKGRKAALLYSVIQFYSALQFLHFP